MEHAELRMTVLRIHADQTKTLEQINLYDVDFIETEKRKIVYHIGEKMYHHIHSKSEIDEFLIHKGFDPLDKPNLVNLKKIRKFDEEYGKVYFVENPNSTSKFATVARIKYSFLKNLMYRIVAHNTHITQEIKMDHEKKSKSIWKGLFENQ